jgi:hypothetical protein
LILTIAAGPGTEYMAFTNGNGTYKSTDNGVTWNLIGSFTPSLPQTSIYDGNNYIVTTRAAAVNPFYTFFSVTSAGVATTRFSYSPVLLTTTGIGGTPFPVLVVESGVTYSNPGVFSSTDSFSTFSTTGFTPSLLSASNFSFQTFATNGDTVLTTVAQSGSSFGPLVVSKLS